jgi:hypothetical protein
MYMRKAAGTSGKDIISVSPSPKPSPLKGEDLRGIPASRFGELQV